MAVTAVLFDYAGVMTEEIGGAVQQVARACGARPADLAELLLGNYGTDGAVGADGAEHPWHRVERGEMTLEELVAWGREQGARRGWELDLGALMTAFVALPIRPGMVERVRELRGRGYRTALVTNNARELAPLWRAKLPVDELFDAVVDSSEVGLRKPHPAIFELTLDRVAARADEAVLLDDMEVNLLGARTLGMNTVLVGGDPAPALAELDRLLAG